MALSLKVHETRRIQGTTQVRRTRVVPYIRLNMQGQPPIFLQAGKAFADEGREPLDPEELPGWVREAIDRMKPEARVKVGFGTKDDLAALKKRRRNGRNLATSELDLSDITGEDDE